MNAAEPERSKIRLYIAGSSARSSLAVSNVRCICDRCLKNCYDLEVIDIYQQPELAEAENIIAAPTLIRKLPGPVLRIVGDMSDKDLVISILGAAC